MRAPRESSRTNPEGSCEYLGQLPRYVGYASTLPQENLPTKLTKRHVPQNVQRYVQKMRQSQRKREHPSQSGHNDPLASPAMYRDNLDREPPFDRQPGQAPALSDAEIADIIVFLGTLNDGWSGPNHPVTATAAAIQ